MGKIESNHDGFPVICIYSFIYSYYIQALGIVRVALRPHTAKCSCLVVHWLYWL